MDNSSDIEGLFSRLHYDPKLYNEISNFQEHNQIVSRWILVDEICRATRHSGNGISNKK